MLISLIILIITSNAVTNDKKKSIIYSRMMMQGLILASYIAYTNLFIKPLEKGIGLYGGMFNVNLFTQGFNIFIMIVVSTIIILTAFYPRVIYFITTVESKENSLKIIPLSSLNYVSSGVSEEVNNVNRKFLPIKVSLNDKSSQFSIIEYALVISFVLCGALLLMSTGDLITMFLSIELQSYGLYILCTLHRDSESATSSGLTYFLLGGMSSCFILFGSALLYVNSGSTNLDNIYIISTLSEVVSLPYNSISEDTISNLYKPHYIGISLIFIIVGFLFKVSAAPFHFWSPDVYDGIPTVVTTFVAIVAKIPIFVFILQLVLNMDFTFKPEYNMELSKGLETFEVNWKNVLVFSSLMSLVIGSLLGLTQYRIKRLLAYSTISHVGFILLALSVGKVESIQGYIFYILQYTISNINAFFILIAIGFTLRYKHNKLDEKVKFADINNSPIQLISQLKGYFYINSFISISLAITLFSFVGVPPLIGFFAKQMVLSAALDQGYIFITLIAIITSVIGAVYYLNVIKTMFFQSNSDTEKYDYMSESYVTEKTLNEKYKLDKWQSLIHTNLNYNNNISINSALSTTIAVLTMAILTFICVPNEWLRAASILSITLFKL